MYFVELERSRRLNRRRWKKETFEDTRRPKTVTAEVKGHDKQGHECFTRIR